MDLKIYNENGLLIFDADVNTIGHNNHEEVYYDSAEYLAWHKHRKNQLKTPGRETDPLRFDIR